MLAVVSLALGDHHSVILKTDGSVWSTPIALHGDLVSARGVSKYFAQLIAGGAQAVAAGASFSLMVKQDGTVWAMGRNSRGQLGDGTKVSKDTFAFVKMLAGAKDVAAGSFHSMVLTQEGDVWISGWNKYGQLGVGTIKKRAYSTRFRHVIRKEAKAIAAGETHCILLKQDGSVWGTGRNYHGQLGDGSKIDRLTFVVTIYGGVAVAAGGCHSMVLKQDGSVWATGWNRFGQLGDGSTVDRSTYVRVVSSGAKAVAVGSRHSMMLKQDGSMWTTGYSVYGKLEDLGNSRSAMIDSQVFMQVISGGVKLIAAGAFHSMVLQQDGSIWATGSNEYGQFGDGSTRSRIRFVVVKRFHKGLGYKKMV